MSDQLKLEFVLIPAGELLIGSIRSVDRLSGIDEFPQHRLLISDYHIMRYPVTNRQYGLFVEATDHRAPRKWPASGFPNIEADHPVTGVSFADSVAFCHWAAGIAGLQLRLPTEPEWEKAARGPYGRLYPWGDKWQEGLCNTLEARTTGTTPVNRYSPAGDSLYGVADMAGNVQEWCSSLFGPYPYDPADGREQLVYQMEAGSLLPQQHETGAIANAERPEANLGKHTSRGGSWRGSKNEARCAYRSWAAPMHRSDDHGFRCCYEP